MNDEELDRILSAGGRDEILPSAGFAESVMTAVREEAAAPPPIPFPWARAVPLLIVGVVAVLGVAGILWALASSAATSAVSSRPTASVSASDWMPGLLRTLHFTDNTGIGWIVASLSLAWISWKVSMRLAGVER